MSLQYSELRPTSGWDHFVSLGHPSKFQRVSSLGSVTARQTAALNRGRHLYSAGRPPRWALAHISSCVLFQIGVYQNEYVQVEKDTVIQWTFWKAILRKAVHFTWLHFSYPEVQNKNVHVYNATYGSSSIRLLKTLSNATYTTQHKRIKIKIQRSVVILVFKI